MLWNLKHLSFNVAENRNIQEYWHQTETFKNTHIKFFQIRYQWLNKSSYLKILCAIATSHLWQFNWIFGLFLFYSFIYFWPCCAACGILTPQPGIKPRARPSLNHWTARELYQLNICLYIRDFYRKLSNTEAQLHADKLLWGWIHVRFFSIWYKICCHFNVRNLTWQKTLLSTHNQDCFSVISVLNDLLLLNYLENQTDTFDI